GELKIIDLPIAFYVVGNSNDYGKQPARSFLRHCLCWNRLESAPLRVGCRTPEIEQEVVILCPAKLVLIFQFHRIPPGLHRESASPSEVDIENQPVETAGA